MIYKKAVISVTIIFLVIIIVPIIYFINKPKLELEPLIPSDVLQHDMDLEEARKSECPYWYAGIASKTENYEVKEYSCPFFDNLSDKSGEKISVQLRNGFTKSDFEGLLKNGGLILNEKLQINYIE